MTLEDQLLEAQKEITFESEVLDLAPKMSNANLQKEIDDRISKVNNKELNVEIRERLAKEARVLAIMALRRRR